MKQSNIYFNDIVKLTCENNQNERVKYTKLTLRNSTKFSKSHTESLVPTLNNKFSRNPHTCTRTNIHIFLRANLTRRWFGQSQNIIDRSEYRLHVSCGRVSWGSGVFRILARGFRIVKRNGCHPSPYKLLRHGSVCETWPLSGYKL